MRWLLTGWFVWECAYTVPGHLAIFFIKSTARTIDYEWLRLKNWAFHPIGSLLRDVTFLLFGRTGVFTRLDSDVINHRNNSNKVEMDLDIFTSWYTISSHVVMIFLVIDQFTQLLQWFQYDIPFYCALWEAFSWSWSWSWSQSWSWSFGEVKTLPIFFDWMNFKLSQCNPQDYSLQ